jgi:hypothetical protein
VRRVHREVAAGPGVQAVQEGPVRLGEGELHGVIVDLGRRESNLLVIRQPVRSGSHIRVQIRIVQVVVDVEHDVVGGVGFAVGPADALAQFDGVFLDILAGDDAFGYVVFPAGEIRFPVNQTFEAGNPEHAAPLGATADETDAQFVTVHALFAAQVLDDARFGGQALLNGRQLPAGNQRVEHR